MSFKPLFILLSLLLLSLPLQAQLFPQDYLESFRSASAKNLNTQTYSQLGDYTGSPFIYDDFQQAVIFTKAGEEKRVPFFNLDAYSNRYVISEGNGVDKNNFLWLNSDQIEKVTVEIDGGITLQTLYLETSLKSKNESAIVELLYGEGDIKFVRKYEKEYSKQSNFNTGYTSSNDAKARFKSGDEVYFVRRTFEPISLKNSKAFAKLYGKKDKEVRKFMKKQKLDYDNPEHLPIILASYPVAEMDL
jgi:hypothetical protein